MNEVLTVIVLTLMAGVAMPLGAAVAVIETIRPAWLEEELRHSVVAFGGGALLAAVALVLVPEGMAGLDTGRVVAAFAGGGIAFMALDRLLAWIDTPASQLAAMLSDFIPEAMALGAAFAQGEPTGFLLAGLIALQNLPEGFNAYRELRSALSRRSILIGFCGMSLLGPVAGLIGYYHLASRPELTSAIMLFAAGGILYLIFQDIAPQARLQRQWAPPLGAVAGFLLGMVGQAMVGG